MRSLLLLITLVFIGCSGGASSAPDSADADASVVNAKDGEGTHRATSGDIAVLMSNRKKAVRLSKFATGRTDSGEAVLGTEDAGDQLSDAGPSETKDGSVGQPVESPDAGSDSGPQQPPATDSGLPVDPHADFAGAWHVQGTGADSGLAWRDFMIDADFTGPQIIGQQIIQGESNWYLCTGSFDVDVFVFSCPQYDQTYHLTLVGSDVFTGYFVHQQSTYLVQGTRK